LILLKQALDFRYDPNLPFRNGADEIIAMHTRFVNMGPIDLDHIKIILLLNAFGDRWEHIQSSLWSSLDSPNFGVNSILRRLDQEDSRARSRAAQSGDTATALAAVCKDKPPRICSNCQKEGHIANFCIKPGGGMAGKTLDEARTAQRNARRSGRNGNNSSQQSTSATANVAAMGAAPVERTVTIDGQTFTLTPSIPSPPVAVSVNTAVALSDTVFPGNLSDYDTDASSFAPSINFALAGAMPAPHSLPAQDEFKFKAYMALNGPSHTSVDWRANSSDTSAVTHPVGPIAYTAKHSPLSRTDSIPFILDSGANCHISPERGDFKTLNPIPSLMVKGFGGSSIEAIGMGTIEVSVASGRRLSLTNVLFVPKSKIRLLSVSSLNCSGNYVTHFDSSSCWVTTKSGSTIIKGALSTNCRLYTVSLTCASVTHAPQHASALVASHAADVETWHRRLGHCSIRSVVDMARKGSVEGMAIDLSSAPPKCTHCVLGKQTCSPVPKVREGPKAGTRLEKVYVDLCGPMPCVSHSGCLYAMNIIDDFSGYVWSLPLRSKGDAALVLQLWHKHVMTQSGLPLKSLITDNGELVSNSMRDWCASLGITHTVTAPYTSAQNGHAERVHRTILGKARAMRLACNAPPSMWDEFCATAAYLTNFTATPTLNHKTAYELWFGHRPSLSHL
jgi:hypothetical protein